MTPHEKTAFRQLLAHAVIHIRGHSRPSDHPSFEASQAALRHINAVANLFHNLALYSAIDFEGFEEERFWKDFRYFLQRVPELNDFESEYHRSLKEIRA